MRPLAGLDRCQGEIINLGTEQALTTGDGIRIVEGLLGRAAQVDRQGRRAGDQSRTQANIAKARRLLDYGPATTLEDGLSQTVAWYRAQSA